MWFKLYYYTVNFFLFFKPKPTSQPPFPPSLYSSLNTPSLPPRVSLLRLFRCCCYLLSTHHWVTRSLLEVVEINPAIFISCIMYCIGVGVNSCFAPGPLCSNVVKILLCFCFYVLFCVCVYVCVCVCVCVCVLQSYTILSTQG